MPSSELQVARSIGELRETIKGVRERKLRVGFVPTMGYLHQGHLSLVEICQQHADYVVVSIFVNPTQFGPNEDLDKYPRDFEGDLRLLQERRVDLVFAPDAGEVYPGETYIHFDIEKLGNRLCGARRPGHFEGVLQVVAKLFNLVQPDVAVFGQKDLQQLLIIKRMVDELNFPVQIIGGPTIRESDGLAMSSRNAYLSQEERQQSAVLYKSLKHVQDLITKGEREATRILSSIKTLIERETSAQIDYIELVKIEDLQPVEVIDGRIAVALAAYFGKARLIDNIVLEIEGENVREIFSLD